MHAPAAEQMALEPMTQFEPVNPAAPPPMLATAVSSKNTAAPVMAVSVAPAWSPTPAGARALHWQPCEILGGGTLSAPPLVVATARPRPLPVVLAQPVPARTRPLPPPPLPPPPELLAASPETCLQDVSQISPSPPKQPALLPTAAAAATPASGFAPPAAPPRAPAPVSPAPSQPGPALSTSTADILLSLSRAAPPAAPPATPVAGPRQAHANNGRVAGGAARAQARPKRQRTARGLGARRPPTAATLPSILPDAPPALPFSVPRAPDDELAAEAAGFRVKLSLTVCSGGVDGRPVGLVVADCGKCANCRDKRKFGGMGTKRQKCIAKKSTGEGPVPPHKPSATEARMAQPTKSTTHTHTHMKSRA
jgi:hypothetical protein